MICKFYCNLHTVPDMKRYGEKKTEMTLQLVDGFKVYVTLTFDYNGIQAI